MTKAEIIVEKVKDDEASFTEVFALLLDLHKAGGYAALDVNTAATNAYTVLREGMTFVARKNGEAVGTIALTEIPFWYSKTTFLQDAWLFVKPKHRRGKVGVMLMRAARDEAEKRKKIAFITVNNPDRRQKKTKASLESQTAGYVPLGYTLKIR